MIVQRMYIGGREVVRVFRAGRQIWPLGTDVELSVIMDIFTAGYHAMLAGEAIVLTAHEPAVSVPTISPAALPIIGMGAAGSSQTACGGGITPLAPVVCVCDAASMTQGELSTLIMAAISFADRTDILSERAVQTLVAAAVYGDHREDSVTTPEISGLVAGAVYGEHTADIATTPEVTAEVPAAAYGAFTEDNGNTDSVSMYEPPSAVFADSQSDSKSESAATMIPFRVDGVVEMDSDTESRTEKTAEADISGTVPMVSLLRLVTTCQVHLLAAPVAGMDSRADSKTVAAFLLQFDGEQPEESWHDPVQTGSNLYIRSVWLFWYDGEKGYIDTDVWYEVIRDGSNLYIRSVDTSWQDGEKAYIDLSVFYEPKQTDGNLYIRSAASMWTDGDSANIDTEFFLEPVQDGSNLYIRQNIFGGE